MDCLKNAHKADGEKRHGDDVHGRQKQPALLERFAGPDFLEAAGVMHDEIIRCEIRVLVVIFTGGGRIS